MNLQALFHFFAFTIIFGLSTNSFSQTEPKSNLGTGTSGSENFEADSVPVAISKRIYKYLETCGIKQKHTIVNFKSKNYFVMATLKSVEGITLIWVDFHFDALGDWTKKVTKISDVDDVDCAVLSKKICDGIKQLKIGFKKEYDSELRGIIYVSETKKDSYIEIFQGKYPNEIKVKFDFQGKLIEN